MLHITKHVAQAVDVVKLFLQRGVVSGVSPPFSAVIGP